MQSKITKHNIIIAGEGGQGVQKMGEIIARTAFNANLKSTYIPNFTVQQRGGVSIAYIRISSTQIIYPKFEKASLAVVLSNRALEHIKTIITPKTNIISNSTLANPKIYKNIKYKKLSSIPASKLSKKIGPRSFNMIMLGKIIHEINALNLEDIKQEVTNIFQYKYDKKPELENQNNQALKIGHEQ